MPDLQHDPGRRRRIERLIAPLDMNAAVPLDSLAYRFDIVLRGRAPDTVRKPAGGELMAQPLPYLRETASQTAGPYVHIGLAPGAAGLRLFDAGAVERASSGRSRGRADPDRGPRRRRRRRAGARCADRALAGQRRRPLQASGGPPAESRSIRRSGAGAGRSGLRDRALLVRDGEARAGAGPHGRPMAPHVNLWIVARGINIGLTRGCTSTTRPRPTPRTRCCRLIEHGRAARRR